MTTGQELHAMLDGSSRHFHEQLLYLRNELAKLPASDGERDVSMAVLALWDIAYHTTQSQILTMVSLVQAATQGGTIEFILPWEDTNGETDSAPGDTHAP